MRDSNRYRRDYDSDMNNDRRDYDRSNEYNNGRQSNQYYNRPYEQDFNRSGYDYPMSNTGRYSSFDNQGYGSGRSGGNRQSDYGSNYNQSYGGVNDDYSNGGNSDYRNRGFRSGNYGSDRRNDWNWSNDRNYDRRDRGWWDKTKDEVSSWFGDDEAQRRRRRDEMRENSHRGKGPKNYKRSSDRIKEDVNDRLSDHWMLDASNIEVEVKDSEITLNGTVDDRDDKRTAEDIAESVSGVTHVQNNLRVSKNEDNNEITTKTSTSRTRKNEMQASNS